MEISLEGFILVNFLMSGAILTLTARSRGRVRGKRIIFSAGFSTVYALALHSGYYPQLNSLLCKMGLAAALSLVSMPVESWGDWGKALLLLTGATVFVGGVCEMILRLAGRSSVSLLGGMGAGCIALAAVLEARGKKLEKWEAQVQMRKGEKTIRLTAMIDTGNRLREPISGLPVMVVEKRALRGLLPPEMEESEKAKGLPSGFRLVAFSGLGGQGAMVCFQPDEMLVSYGQGWMGAPDIWVAAYPGRLPGDTRALAPGVIGRIAPAKKKKSKSGKEGSGALWSIPHNRP